MEHLPLTNDEQDFFEEEPASPRSSVLVLPVRQASRGTGSGAGEARPEAWALPVAEVLPAWLSGPLERAGYPTLGALCTQTRGQLAGQATAQRWWGRGQVRRALDGLVQALDELGLHLLLTGADLGEHSAQVTPLHPTPPPLDAAAAVVLEGWREGWRQVFRSEPPPAQPHGDARAAAAILAARPGLDAEGSTRLAEHYLREWAFSARRWPTDPTPSTWALHLQRHPGLMLAPLLPDDEDTAAPDAGLDAALADALPTLPPLPPPPPPLDEDDPFADLTDEEFARVAFC